MCVKYVKYWSNFKQNIIRGIFQTCVLRRRVDWYSVLSLLQSPLLCFHYSMPSFSGGWLFSNHSDDGSSKLLRNAGVDIPIYTISYSTRVVYLPTLLLKSQWHEFLFRNRMATDWLNILRYEFMVDQMTDLPILVDDWLTEVLTSIMIRCLMNFQLTRLITDLIIEWRINLCP